jgi:3-(methylsulfanyl)propanoyl-CoA dehydrogenase
MPSYRAPVKDMEYLLNDVFNLERYANLPGFGDATPDIIHAVLSEGSKLAEGVLQPLNVSGDGEGCTWHDDGSVTTPKGFKEAYKLFCEGGWGGLSQDPEYGGQGLPYVLASAMEEMFVSANMAFNMYPGLTGGSAAALSVAGTDKQKATFLPNMIAGKWCGTMNLTESHCGTDLGMMRTKAEPQDDGTYKITGQKIFISAGEHDLSENIIHMVLAKIPGGPEGVKGISLFIVPKFLVNDDGSLGARNGVSCGSIEEKMGIHGNSTCVLNYDQATGYLLGREHEGLKPMFIMMNAARIGVGIQGLALAEVAYQNAAEYARDRLQGRSITGTKNEDGPADPIIVHPDVRRMLMECRAFAEGARALAFWTSIHVDRARRSPDEAEQERSDNIAALLTPVIKAFLTDIGYNCTTLAQQVFGGHGYIKEWGMEQFVRDARISMIFEGANGIQALDLVGRKLPSKGGAPIRQYFAILDDFIKNNTSDEMAEYIEPFQGAVNDLQSATMWLMQNGMENPDNAGAASTSYLHLLGLVAFGHMWVKMADRSLRALSEGTQDTDFHQNKLHTARYFVKRMLPDTQAHLRKIEAGSEILMAMPAEAF